VGRVGALAVALGVGTAVAVGWGCGTATAEAPGTAPTASEKDADGKRAPFKMRVTRPAAAANEGDDESAPKKRRALEKFDAKVRAAVRDALDDAGRVQREDDRLSASPPRAANRALTSVRAGRVLEQEKLREPTPRIRLRGTHCHWPSTGSASYRNQCSHRP
jgi:triacylglycerol lipase